MKRLKLVLLLALMAGTGAVSGQVTVGSDVAPEKAALLEIKSQAANASNVTSTKGGLGLPRVQLVSKTTLQPFIATTDAEWNATNQAATKTKHSGLMVYNLATTNGFKAGVYIWNGTQWVQINTGPGDSGRYFYLPSFNIPLTTPGNTEQTFDLYAEYKKQFTRSGNTSFVSNPAFTAATVPSPQSGTLYTAAQLDYIITYYDSSVIQVTSIDNTGKMKYKVISQDTTPASFLNVVFVVKE